MLRHFDGQALHDRGGRRDGIAEKIVNARIQRAAHHGGIAADHLDRGACFLGGRRAELDVIEAELRHYQREARELVDLFFEEIRAALSSGEQVKLSGFGNFQLRDKPQRPGRNPKTGEEIPITARRVVIFRASQKLKAHLGHSASNSCQ